MLRMSPLTRISLALDPTSPHWGEVKEEHRSPHERAHAAGKGDPLLQRKTPGKRNARRVDAGLREVSPAAAAARDPQGPPAPPVPPASRSGGAEP